jgi:hypothetical protein
VRILEIYYYIIAIVIIFFVFPYLGKRIYPLKTKRLISIYMIGVGVLFAINMIFSDSIDAERGGVIINIYFTQFLSANMIFIFIVLFFFFGGVGFFGSLAEKSSEVIEDLNLFTDLKRRTSPKAYIMYLVYGYTFIFGIFALNKVFLIILGVTYKPEFIGLEYIFQALQMESLWVVIIGISLFCLKSFKYGYFSKEFWKTNVPYSQMAPKWYRFIRKATVIFMFVWANYVALMIIIIDIFSLTSPFGTYGGLDAMQLVFYTASFIQSLYFYTNMEKIVDPLKVNASDFKKKIDKNIKVDDKNQIKFN